MVHIIVYIIIIIVIIKLIIKVIIIVIINMYFGLTSHTFHHGMDPIVTNNRYRCSRSINDQNE